MKENTIFSRTSLKTLMLYAFFCTTLYSFGQADTEIVQEYFSPETPGCIYYTNEFRGQFSVPASPEFQARMGSQTPCTNIIVNYSGFTPQAQAAFQYAVDLWALSIESQLTIIVSATYQALAPGTLGSAGSGFVTLNPVLVPGAIADTFYPIPLAEKMANTNVNGTNPDIEANFNSTVNWYFGLDANPPPGQFDFVTVVLHELGHGMGFIGFGDVSPLNQGTVRLGNPPRPSVFDNFIENVGSQSILSFSDPSIVLAAQLTSGNLFCNSANAIAGNGGTRPEMFAPAVFNPGSSYSHWDETIFPSGGNNSLMTPQLGPGEAIHVIGTNTSGFFEDMGWTICAALSTEKFDYTIVDIRPNPFSGTLTIKLATASNDSYGVDIFDINGRLVFATTAEANAGTIDITNLDQLGSAIYFMRITNTLNGASITKKVIRR